MAENVCNHINSKPPLEADIRSRLSEKGWAVGRPAKNDGRWNCPICNEEWSDEKIVCGREPTCKGVNGNSFFAYLKSSDFSVEQVPPQCWGDVLTEVTGVKHDNKNFCKEDAVQVHRRLSL